MLIQKERELTFMDKGCIGDDLIWFENGDHVGYIRYAHM